LRYKALSVPGLLGRWSAYKAFVIHLYPKLFMRFSFFFQTFTELLALPGVFESDPARLPRNLFLESGQGGIFMTC